MSSRKKIPITVHSEDGKDTYSVETGDVSRPPLWVWRKAVHKLSELYPLSVATDIEMIIQSSSYAENDRDIPGYREKVVPYLFMLYQEFEGKRKTTVDTALLWLIRLSHYFWFGGPSPARKYKPRRKTKKSLTELWRDNLVCPVCNVPFSYPSLRTDARDEVLSQYNTWMQAHVPACTSANWNKAGFLDAKKAEQAVRRERARREKEEQAAYERWREQQLNPGTQKSPSDIQAEVYEKTVEIALSTIRKCIRDKKLAEAIHRTNLLVKYYMKKPVTHKYRQDIRELLEILYLKIPPGL